MAATHDLSIGVFAGPLEREVLEDDQPYKTLNMRGLILYQMSSFCAICTFQWLADILVVVLSFLDHYILFDWALSIIGLVIIVRTLMHPITKKSQVGMQRFTRKMGKLKPQMDKINQKYGDDPKRKQQEQMKLMRENGVNPLQMLGCLPLFLQMPIWIAPVCGAVLRLRIAAGAGILGCLPTVLGLALPCGSQQPGPLLHRVQGAGQFPLLESHRPEPASRFCWASSSSCSRST